LRRSPPHREGGEEPVLSRRARLGRREGGPLPKGRLSRLLGQDRAGDDVRRVPAVPWRPVAREDDDRGCAPSGNDGRRIPRLREEEPAGLALQGHGGPASLTPSTLPFFDISAT